MVGTGETPLDEFYEDWKKEVISWNAGGTVDDYDESLSPQENINIINRVEKGSRASLGLDTSIEAYRKEIAVLMCNIGRGAMVEICPDCQSRKGTFKDLIYTCECGKSWNPMKLMYRGFD